MTDTHQAESASPAIQNDALLTPVAPSDRIWILDMLRGWAVLGILAVNAVSFAWPMQVMMSEGLPPGHSGGLDLRAFWVVDVFFSDKFRTLFSMLFGVSVFLVGGEVRNEDRSQLLVRRLLWLGVFGLIHGLAIWYGDILLHYAYCGLLMMLMRSWSARRLLLIGGSVTAMWGLMIAATYLAMAHLPPDIADQFKQGRPEVTPEAVATAVQAYLGSGPLAPWLQNAKGWLALQGASMVLIPVTVPLMMIGLGLFKSGWLSGRAPLWTYVLVAIVGGANLAAFAQYRWLDLIAGAEDPTRGLGEALSGFAILITLFYASVLILLTRLGLKILTAPLAPVGRMAFTNYLSQSLIMASLFYLPWGPKLMGQFGPAKLLMVVAAIWLLQLIWSPIWLRVFRMGPLEWLWRSLTYRRLVRL